MLLLLSAFNNFNTPVERTLLGLCNVQKETKTTVSVVAACMLHELLLAENLYKAKKLDSKAVTFQHIQNKYGLPRYQVSRNAVMLSNESIDDASTTGGSRQGKGWVEIQDKENKFKGANDRREKALVLTAEGRKAALIIYGDANLPKSLPARRKE